MLLGSAWRLKSEIFYTGPIFLVVVMVFKKKKGLWLGFATDQVMDLPVNLTVPLPCLAIEELWVSMTWFHPLLVLFSSSNMFTILYSAAKFNNATLNATQMSGEK